MNAMAYACGAMGREIESRRGIEGSFKKISTMYNASVAEGYSIFTQLCC
jgi:hypothetical protein